MNIPLENQEIRSQIRKNNRRIYLKVVIGILLVALLELFVFLYYAEKQDASSIVVYVVIGLLVFVPLKELLPILRDTSWEGNIREIEFLEEHDSRVKTTCRNTATRTKDACVLHIMRLHVQTVNQKPIIKEFLCDNPKQIPPYREGDIVRYYRGTRYPILIDADGHRPICVMCGCTTISETGHCEFCGISIIEAKERIDT